MEGFPALHFWDCVLETFLQSDAKGNATRPSGKRHSSSHFIDHMSFDVVDHVPSNVPESSLSARLYIFEDNQAVIRMTTKGLSQSETRITNSQC